MNEKYPVFDRWGNIVGWFIPKNADLATMIVTFLIGIVLATIIVAVIFIFQIIRLCFRYPKIGLPIVAIILIVGSVEYYLHPELFQGIRFQPSFAQTKKASTVVSAPVATITVPTVGPVQGIGSINADELNVRSGPSANDTVVGKVSKYERVNVLATDPTGKWVHIIYNGGEGWVSKQFITLQTTESATSANTATPMPMPSTGMWIIKVTPGSEAAAAGLHAGQLLVSLNNEPIQSAKNVSTIVSAHIGSPLTAVLWQDGKQESITLTLKDKQLGITLCQLSRCPQGKSP